MYTYALCGTFGHCTQECPELRVFLGEVEDVHNLCFSNESKSTYHLPREEKLTEDDFCRACGEVNRHSLSHYCDICVDRYEWVRRVL